MKPHFVLIHWLSSTHLFHEASFEFRSFVDPKHGQFQSTDKHTFFAVPSTYNLIQTNAHVKLRDDNW